MVPPAPPQATLLIVDDMPENLAVLGHGLSGRYRVKVATRGEQALEILRSGDPPDLVLLDVEMPGMDGYEVCRQIKADPNTADIPVLFVSARGEVEDETQGFAVGGSDYIAKPIRLPLVFARVESQLTLARQKRVLADLLQTSEAQLQSLRNLEAMRDSLVHMVVHDMRSLLGLVHTFHDYMEEIMFEEPAQLPDLLRQAKGNMMLLIEMAATMLDISRMEAGAMELSLETGPLEGPLQDILTNLEPLKGGRELRFIAPEGPQLAAFDRRLVQRVLLNLVVNAFKYTASKSGVVEVRLLSAGDQVRVEVQDNGPGIPQANLDRVFVLYWQAKDPQNRNTHSTGMGLTFCRMVVEAHGGTIGVSSAPGSGATFWFELPRNGPSPRPS